VYIQEYRIQWVHKSKHFRIKTPMIFTNQIKIILKNHYQIIPYKWITSNTITQLDNSNSFLYSKEIISSKFLKHIMMDSIKNLVQAILTICTKLRIITLYKTMRKIIYRNLNTYQLVNAKILKELNRSLIITETLCLQMDFKPMKDQLQVLIFNKMGCIKTSKSTTHHNLSFRWMTGAAAAHNFKWMIEAVAVISFR
jgi:hypothetical protein